MPDLFTLTINWPGKRFGETPAAEQQVIARALAQVAQELGRGHVVDGNNLMAARTGWMITAAPRRKSGSCRTAGRMANSARVRRYLLIDLPL